MLGTIHAGPHRLAEALQIENRQRLVAAKHLVNDETIRVDVECPEITYCHILLDMHAVILAEAPHPYVSRGGLKLAAGLEHFGFDPAGRHCLDVGASTGGFTDVLLKRGAAHVTALDTGKGQLHPSLQQDRRVASFESSDVRHFEAGLLAQPPGLIVVDVSFISLVLVLPAITALAAPEAALVALIKPQFEVGKARIEKGGIVRDEAAIAEVCSRIEAQLASLGWQVPGLIDSPITGGDGNREFLVGARLRPSHP